MKSRGLRNHNPGNLRIGAQWRGLANVTEMTSEQLSELSFCVFISPIYGIRALAKLLMNYQKRHGLKTVRGIIDRYAPPVENNTNSYASHVANHMGIGADERVNLRDTLAMTLMIEAIIQHENGSQPYPHYIIADAILLASI